MTCQNAQCGQLQGNPVSVDVKNILETCDCCAFAGGEDVSWASYIGQQPTQPDNTVTIYDQGGRRFNTISKCVSEDIAFAIRVRGTDYLETYQKAQEVAAALNLVSHYIVSNEGNFHTTYQSIRQTTLPAIEGYDDQNRPVFLINFSGMRELALN